MPAWSQILCWMFVFGLTHMAPASVALRPRLVALLGQGPYLGLYSLISLATFVPAVRIYLNNIHTGPLLWQLGDLPAVHIAALALAGASFTFVVAAPAQPSPASIGARGGSVGGAYGLTRITRHPMFLSMGLWGLAHVLVNGFASDVAFFGGLFAVGLIGCMHQDARKRITEKGRLDAFFAETSLLPFGAILSGRGRLVLSELPWPALAVGVAVATILYNLHDWMFA
ncbi:MAG: hypothetical protein HY899_13100 [Deltaproteobacteria bacterium]|nr:hypothetical protein [Deltaproteobacteria bacterium]